MNGRTEDFSFIVKYGVNGVSHLLRGREKGLGVCGKKQPWRQAEDGAGPGAGLAKQPRGHMHLGDQHLWWPHTMQGCGFCQQLSLAAH